MKRFFDEFKEFALKGNMIDIAIGVIIGNAFNKVIDVLVKQIFLPPLSMLTNGSTMANKKLILRDTVVKDGKIVEEVAIGYGEFLGAAIDFFIIAMTVFIVVKIMNQLKNKAEDTTDTTVQTPKNIELLNRMTELLEEQNKMLGEKKT